MRLALSNIVLVVGALLIVGLGNAVAEKDEPIRADAHEQQHTADEDAEFWERFLGHYVKKKKKKPTPVVISMTPPPS